MKILKIKNYKDASWMILLLPLVLSSIGLIALNSISYQNNVSLINPFTKQLVFLLIALCVFLFSFITPKYIIHKYSFIIYGFGIIIVILPFLVLCTLEPIVG